jgi:glycosyltransferase involved in cell wall biosynthesis
MRVCLLVHDLSPSGGVKVILAHARGLRAAGIEAELVVTGGGEAAAPDGLTARRLEDARTTDYDWAVATWWETAAALYEVRAARRLVFLQSFEQRFYAQDEPLERQGAAAVLCLPVDFVAISDWMGAVLSELRPDARWRVVRNGIEKERFAGRRRSPGDGPLRVLVEGQPTLWFKGVGDAVAAVRAMGEPAHLTLVALDPAGVGVDADRVVGGLSPDEMAGLYSQSDVLLKLSRVEGLPLPPLEAAHAGVPSVVAPFGAHADFVEHGRNGLVVGYDDVPGTARALDLLAADRELLERLSRGALELAESWPDERDAGAAFADALRELDAAPPPNADAGLRELLATIRLTQEQTRGATGDAAERLRAAESALADAQALVHELASSRDECAELHAEVGGELDRIKSGVAYRAAAKARRTLGRGDR